MTKGSAHWFSNTVLDRGRKLMAWLRHLIEEPYDADNGTFNKKAFDFPCVKLF